MADNFLTYSQLRKKIDNRVDTIEGEISRMCVTDDIDELNSMAFYLHSNISYLLVDCLDRIRLREKLKEEL